tara:strand:- start:561 stop:713 length:153 start_codon:yes stop_codon:yes gene_type:complete
MTTNKQTYLIWLIGVIVWNFGFPAMPPLADVLAAVILSLGHYLLARQFNK